MIRPVDMEYRRHLKCQVTQGETLQILTGFSTAVMEQMTMMTSSFSVLQGLNVAIMGDSTSHWSSYLMPATGGSVHVQDGLILNTLPLTALCVLLEDSKD